MTNATGTDPDQTHADPAVQALINDGWLGIWDYPTTVDDLANAAGLVRAADRDHAQLVRTEYAATSVLTDGNRNRTETGTSRAVAQVVLVDLAAGLRMLGPDSPTAKCFKEHLIECRQVFRTADGWEHTSPWRPETEMGRGVDTGESTEEWASAVHHYEGGPRYRPADDAEHAALVADGIATHIASLNEPTHRANGITGTAVVHRTRVRYADGYLLISPWRTVRAGKPLED